MLGEKTLRIEALSDQDLEALARKLQPHLAANADEKRIIALEKEVHRLSRELYKLRLEVTEQVDPGDYDH